LWIGLSLSQFKWILYKSLWILKGKNYNHRPVYRLDTESFTAGCLAAWQKRYFPAKERKVVCINATFQAKFTLRWILEAYKMIMVYNVFNYPHYNICTNLTWGSTGHVMVCSFSWYTNTSLSFPPVGVIAHTLSMSCWCNTVANGNMVSPHQVAVPSSLW